MVIRKGEMAVKAHRKDKMMNAWILYAELCGDNSCITLFCDSQSAICLTKDKIFYKRTKHIDVRYHYVCHVVVAQGKLNV